MNNYEYQVHNVGTQNTSVSDMFKSNLDSTSKSINHGNSLSPNIVSKSNSTNIVVMP